MYILCDVNRQTVFLGILKRKVERYRSCVSNIFLRIEEKKKNTSSPPEFDVSCGIFETYGEKINKSLTDLDLTVMGQHDRKSKAPTHDPLFVIFDHLAPSSSSAESRKHRKRMQNARPYRFQTCAFSPKISWGNSATIVIRCASTLKIHIQDTSSALKLLRDLIKNDIGRIEEAARSGIVDLITRIEDQKRLWKNLKPSFWKRTIHAHGER